MTGGSWLYGMTTYLGRVALDDSTWQRVWFWFGVLLEGVKDRDEDEGAGQDSDNRSGGTLAVGGAATV